MEYTLTSRQAADRLGVTVKTMQRWEREGRLIPAGRTQTNRRVYTTEQIARFQGLRWSGGQEATRIIAYCRVSRAAQKADLKNQRRVLEDFCMGRGLANVEFVEEVGGGLSCEVLVLNQERLSPEQEMVQDLMTIVHYFSSRLYGLRNYRKKLHEALKQDAGNAKT